MASYGRLSAHQLRVVVDAVRRQLTTSRSRAFFATINISTLVVAVWTLWMYFAHGREQQTASLRQLQLAVRQTELASEFAGTRERLTVENLRLESEAASLAVGEAQEKGVRLSFDVTIENADAKAGLFEVDAALRVENMLRQRVEVSWVVFEWYAGEMKDRVAAGDIVQVNAPPKLERGIEERGPMKWTLRGRRGFYYRDSRVVDRTQLAAKPYFQEGGGPTKSLAPRDEATHTMPLLLRPQKDRWIGVVAIVGINGGKSPQDVSWVSRWFPTAAFETLKEE